MTVPFLSLKSITDKYAQEIHDVVTRVLDSGWYLQGAENEKFENSYAGYIGTSRCVGVANGLDALTLIFRAYIETGTMQPGDEVIVPANAYIAAEGQAVSVMLPDTAFIPERIWERSAMAALSQRTIRNWQIQSGHWQIMVR